MNTHRMMKAALFVEPGRIVPDDKPTTIGGTGVHILRGGYELFAHQRDGVLQMAITP